MNRSDFVIRLLNYYKALRFEGRIYIADSSNARDAGRVKEAARVLSNNIETFYGEYPGLNNAEAISHLLDLVSTPYAVLLPDDDFLVPSSLEQCVSFLESHNEYSAAHGLAVLLSLKSTGAYGPLLWAGKYWQRSIEEGNGASRLLNHLSNYSVTLFSVHRTEQMRAMYAMYKNTSPLADKTFALELVPCCLSVISGKVKELDCLHLVRQAHGQRYLLPDVYDWITSANWFPAWQIFHNCLAKELARQDGIGVDDAEKIVKQAFWSYLAKSLMYKREVRYRAEALKPRSRLREIARSIPGLRSAWHKVRSFLPGDDNKMSLEALLRPSSPYHKDFMPIYRAMTQPTLADLQGIVN